MRLKSITLRNYRGVTESTVDFSDGVTVVEGPNEVGKSSIPEALRLLREAKASSRAALVRNVKPVHLDVGPEATVDLVTGPYELTFRKRWIRDPLTELTVRAPRHEHFTGEAAHERYNTILAETVDSELLRAMEMIQGESMSQPDLAQVTSLHRALDQSGEQPGGHDELVESIEAEYRKYFTAKGQPTGEYRDVATQVDQLDDEVAQLRLDSQEIDGFTEQHHRLAERLEGLHEELQQAAEELQSCEQADQALMGLRDAVDQAQVALEEGQRDLADAAAALQERHRLVAEVDDRARQITSRKAAVEDLESQHTRAKAELDRARVAHERADTGRTRARALADATQRALRQHQDHQELERLGHQIQAADEVSRQRLETQALLQVSTVDQADVERLNALDVEVRVARSARTAAAAAVSVDALGEVPVTLGSRVLGAGDQHEQAILEVLTIEVDGIARIQVRPGTPPAELDTALRNATAGLADALKQAGVSSVEEARRVARARLDAQQRLEKADEALQHILGGAALETIREEHARLTARLGHVARDADASRARLEAEQDQARAAEQEADSELEASTDALERARAAAAVAREDWVRASEMLASARTEHQAAHHRLHEARGILDDSALEETAERRRGAVRELLVGLEAHQSRLQQSNPELVEIHLSNARDLVTGKRQQQVELARQVQNLEVLLADRAKRGLYDKLNQAEAELTAAQEKQERLHRAARAAKVLRETMHRKRAEVQQKYVAPFKAEIERLGKLVYGHSFSMEVTPELSIASRTLDDVTVPFESLSSGTKEQLSLLGRLASARLVDVADGAPVILDDALGFADPDRLRALGAVFNHVGTSAQVILLTCQPERYASLGGARVVRLSRTPLPRHPEG